MGDCFRRSVDSRKYGGGPHTLRVAVRRESLRWKSAGMGELWETRGRRCSAGNSLTGSWMRFLTQGQWPESMTGDYGGWNGMTDGGTESDGVWTRRMALKGRANREQQRSKQDRNVECCLGFGLAFNPLFSNPTMLLVSSLSSLSTCSSLPDPSSNVPLLLLLLRSMSSTFLPLLPSLAPLLHTHPPPTTALPSS